LSPPFGPRGECSPARVPHRPFDVDRDELELARRQGEPAGIADGSDPIAQHDETVLAVQQTIEQFMDEAGIAAQRFANGHAAPPMDAAAGEALDDTIVCVAGRRGLPATCADTWGSARPPLAGPEVSVARDRKNASS
jgi:hypothetical protein